MKKILIIEDNEDVRENTADILELANYKVSTAENGNIGIHIAEQLHPDVILCDIMMPELDGYEVLQRLSKNRKTASIPFIFLTAKTDKTDIRKGMNLGADDYLTKPFNDKDLLEAIEARLKKHNFLKKEFSSRTIKGVSEFIEAASEYMDLEHLSKNYTPRKYHKKELVFMEGNAANALYFIESGTIKTFKTSEKGKELVTGVFSSGHFVGQLSLLSNHGTYIESVAVLEEAEIYEIPKQDFTTLLHANKDVSNKFVHLISNSLVDLQEQLVSVAYATVRQRVAKALLDLHYKGALTNADDNSISIAREDFAGLIGTATETAIRMLTEFKDEGLIKVGYNSKITIQDKKTLENIKVFG